MNDHGTGYRIDRKLKYKDIHDFVSTVHEYNIDVECGHIYLMGEEAYMGGTGNEDPTEPGIEYIIANRFVRNINILMRKSDDPIIIHMKTCGGYWEEGMAIYNAIKACPNPVTIINYTHARSMSSLIFQAANKRVMMPDSCFMFHEGTWGFGGTVKQARTEYEQLVKTGDRMLDIYIESMKRNGKYKKWSKKRIKEFLEENMNKKEEVYLDESSTVQWGLADEIFGENGNYDWRKLTSYTDEQLER